MQMAGLPHRCKYYVVCMVIMSHTVYCILLYVANSLEEGRDIMIILCRWQSCSTAVKIRSAANTDIVYIIFPPPPLFLPPPLCSPSFPPTPPLSPIPSPYSPVHVAITAPFIQLSSLDHTVSLYSLSTYFISF